MSDLSRLSSTPENIPPPPRKKKPRSELKRLARNLAQEYHRHEGTVEAIKRLTDVLSKCNDPIPLINDSVQALGKIEKRFFLKYVRRLTWVWQMMKTEEGDSMVAKHKDEVLDWLIAR